jgi:phosphoglycolate phosphatase
VIGRFALVCLDMAGTTVRDDGAVDAAFTHALAVVGITPDAPRHAEARRFVHETMGWSKADVFAALLPAQDAARATTAFAAAYESIVAAGDVKAIEGAAAVLQTLRERDTRVCLTTGFAPSTRDALLTTLGWTALVDLALSPADVGGHGRPAPDLILGAMAQLGVADPATVAVVGDTVSDLEAGAAAHAGAVIGVLSGAHDQATLGRAPHTALLPDVRHLIKELERAA